MRKAKVTHKKRTKAQHEHKKSRKQRLISSFKGFDNTKDIDLILDKKQQFQDLMGFTNDRMMHLFESAVSLIQQHRFDEASKAAQLLTQLNPFIADFWICLGMAEQANGSSRNALEAYLTAETMDPYRSEPYINAIDCCLDLNDPFQAEAIFHEALNFAKRHPHSPDSIVILKELSLREDLIQHEKVRLKPFSL